MDINPLQRPGSQLLGTDPFKLFLIEFSGMVLNRFKTATKFLDKHVLRTIDHGRGERFDALGEAGVMYHTPGQDLSTHGQQIKHDTFDILVDAKLISHLYLDEIEEAMNHFEVKQRYAGKLGDALAKEMDANIARTSLLAARHPARVPDGFGGSIITGAGMNSDIPTLTKALFDAQVLMDDKDVPDEGRVFICRPRFYSMLAQNMDLINSLYSGTGSIAEGSIMRVAGFQIVKSNTVPNSVVSDSYNGKYNGDFSKTVGICMTSEAVGTVQLKGLTTEAEWDFNRQAWFLAAKFCLGHGILRPECAIEIAAA